MVLYVDFTGMNDDFVKKAYDKDLRKYGYVRPTTINNLAPKPENKQQDKRLYYDDSEYLEMIEKDIAEFGHISDNTISLITGYVPKKKEKPEKREKKEVIEIVVEKKKKSKRSDNHIYQKIFNKYYGSINHCMICGSTEKLQIHHKDKNHKNNDISNLIKLCYKCHCKAHKGDRVYKLMAKRLGQIRA